MEQTLTKQCAFCGVNIQSMGALGWASTSTGGLRCRDGRNDHNPERKRTLRDRICDDGPDDRTPATS